MVKKHSKQRTQKQPMSLREQAVAITRVAKMSFVVAPGAVLFKLAGAIINAIVPLVTAYFAALTTTILVDAFSGNESARNSVIMYVILTALLGFFSTAWNSIDQYIQASMRFTIESRVSDQMYEQFLGLDFWRYDDKKTADLYDKAQNFAQFFAWIFDRLASIVSQCIAMVAGIVALVFLNGWMALAVLVAIIPGVYLQFKLSRAQIAHWNSNVDTRRTRNMIEWNLLQPDTITELRLYGIVPHLLNLRAKLRNKDKKTQIDFERDYIGRRLAADALQSLTVVGALIWVILEIVARRLSVGQFIYVQQVMSRAMTGATGFITDLSTIDEDIANLFDYQEFMQLPRPSMRAKQITTAPKTIEFRDVSFHYQNNTQLVLEHVSFTIPERQHIAIVGENGAGKSTIIKLLAGLYEPTKGQILVDGVSIHDINLDTWHQQLAILRQDFTHYGFTHAKDNVLFGDITKTDHTAYESAINDAEAADFIKKLPRKDKTYLNPWMEDSEGNKGVELSGGQWQRLALARNFYRDAPIVILDEPTSAIDALAESRIFNRLFKEKSKTIITVSHRLTTVKKADVIYMVKDGRIVEQGTCEELINLRGEFYTMFEAQL